jgi:hypothetical protein
MMHRNVWILLAVIGTTATGFVVPTVGQKSFSQRSMSSLFDPDDNDEGSNTPVTRKFTGGYTIGSTSSNSSPRERMMQREFNLVSLATSPAAFLVQAASILVVLVFVLYIGATGQLGLNNEYEDDDDFIYDPVNPSMVVPTVEFQSSSSHSVFL